MPDVTEVVTQRPIIGFNSQTSRLIYGPLELSFDTWALNLGTVAVDLVTDDPANLVNPTVSQCVAWTGDVCRARRTVGGFEVHAAHNHVHYKEFARYELRHLLADGSVDYSAAGLVAMSDKVSFCLIDLERVRDDARPVPTYRSCTITRMGISVGWADVYSEGLTGQQLPIEGLGDGRYALVVSMDYADKLWESDNTNNVVELIVELSNSASQAAIVDRRWP